MSRRYHQGYCDQYGMLQVTAAAIIAPAIVLGTGSWLLTGSPVPLAAIGAVSGSYGYAMGALAHGFANHHAATRQMDSVSGKRLVRLWQAAAYGATVALMNGAFIAMYHSKPAPQDNNQDNSSAAAPYHRAPQEAPLITMLKPPRLA